MKKLLLGLLLLVGVTMTAQQFSPPAQGNFTISTYRYDGLEVAFTFISEGRFVKIYKTEDAGVTTYVALKSGPGVYFLLDKRSKFVFLDDGLTFRLYWGKDFGSYSTFHVREYFIDEEDEDPFKK